MLIERLFKCTESDLFEYWMMKCSTREIGDIDDAQISRSIVMTIRMVNPPTLITTTAQSAINCSSTDTAANRGNAADRCCKTCINRDTETHKLYRFLDFVLIYFLIVYSERLLQQF